MKKQEQRSEEAKKRRMRGCPLHLHHSSLLRSFAPPLLPEALP